MQPINIIQRRPPGLTAHLEPLAARPDAPLPIPHGAGTGPGKYLANQHRHHHFIILGAGKLLFMTVNLKMK